MESAVGHPLQALADALTLAEHPTRIDQSSAHLGTAPEGTPHAVGNSFTNMMQFQDADYVIANPEGYDLNPEITKGIPVIHNQEEALQNADCPMQKLVFYSQYGQILRTDDAWQLTEEKMALTNNAKFMHCLPVRRNIVVADGVLDHPNSLVI